MKNPIMSDAPDYIDGEITMAGSARTYWPNISQNWNSNTQRQYATMYNDVILPYFSEHSLVYYDKSFFDDVIGKTADKGTLQSQRKGDAEKRTYSDATLQKFRYAI